MLGAYVWLTHLVRLETLIEAIKTMVPSKVEANIEAAHKAYQQMKIHEKTDIGIS
jgi:Pyruvate/2-oxoacid:ferredoxin oxidoreductase gamma subunit